MALKKDRWFLPTNTDNLKMIVAQGLITSPDGFSPNKYYRDELENYPGFIPLFKNVIPEKTLKLIVSEQDNMMACLIEIDLTKIPSATEKAAMSLLLLAPLPLSCIKQIIFKSIADKKSLENEQQLSSNFILAELKLHHSKTDQKLFTQEPELADTNNTLVKKEQNVLKVDYKKVYAFGGLLTNLFYFAKNGKISHQIYQNFLDKEQPDKRDMGCIYQYFYGEANDSDELQKMYNTLMDKIISSQNFKDDIVGLLESDIWGDKLKPRTQQLATSLREFENNDTTVSAKFEETKSPLEKLLFMMFYRQKSEALMQYQIDLFTEEDYVLFAMMFGVRDKFIKSAKLIREYQNLQNFISFKMAEYAHKNTANHIEFKPPPQPKTVWQMVGTKNKKVIEKLQLKDSVQTVIKGDFERKGTENIYSGFVEPKYEVIKDAYFKIISKKEIDTTLYNALSKLK